jgi:hypothetical protein
VYKNSKDNEPAQTRGNSSTGSEPIITFGLIMAALLIVLLALIVSLNEPEMLLGGGSITWGFVAGLVTVGILLVYRYRR